jgi:pyruvate dehydrogenase E2 component (dihydrolipoamide acetyltransferase)
MPIEVTLPALSPTMESGTLAKWLVSPGDTIAAGDLLAEIETDKATMEFEAADDGVVAELKVSAGTEDIPVGAVIAVMAQEGEAVPFPGGDRERAEIQPSAQQPEDADDAAQHLPPSTPLAGGSVAAAAVPVDSSADATALASRLAAAKGVGLASLTGSGPDGRILWHDIVTETPAATPPEWASSGAKSAPIPATNGPVEGVPHDAHPLSTMRKTIARRLSASKQTVPHFYLSVTCQIDALIDLRQRLNEELVPDGIKLSVNDMLIRAMTLALRRVPDANVGFGGDRLYRYRRVDIAMAVAVEGGLVTPVIRDAGAKSLAAIAAEARDLVEKAREGRLMPEDYQGGTASISNLGIYGIDTMGPVINPPQSLILGVGSRREGPWSQDGVIVSARLLTATASFDHRAIDEATGADFLAEFRRLVEQPMLMLT